MPWKHILNVKLSGNVIYKREVPQKEIFIPNKEKNLLDKNNLNCEILSSMEVSKYARKC